MDYLLVVTKSQLTHSHIALDRIQRFSEAWLLLSARGKPRFSLCIAQTPNNIIS